MHVVRAPGLSRHRATRTQHKGQQQTCRSAGGDALASDLMWREIQKLAGEKPLVATMGDVAASGGYYMAMAAPLVLAHPLTITGSIGVVTGKFNLAELFERVRAHSAANQTCVMLQADAFWAYRLPFLTYMRLLC